ncbi:MAG: MFS transporter [Hyphomicrobiales bacterium]|nr:MFS transporter [Hyphomicrobiales bacterium]
MTSLSHQEARLIVIGLMLPVFMGSLDNTNLATALPTIGNDLGDVHSLPWLITAYLLSATAVVPLYGKIADIYGRRVTLRIAIVIYMAGSLVCALAPNMLTLILGRALHGLGGGGLSTLGSIVLGDVVAPKERGRYYGYFAVVYTTAGALGPALGGFFSDHLHWSGIFWFNIALGFAALLLSGVLLRRLPRHERPHRLDVVGAVLVVCASVFFMLAINLGGVRLAWTSPQILAMLATAAVVALLLIGRLLTAPEPLIPIAVLRNRQVRYATFAHAFGWGAIFGLNIFLPQYLQNVIGLSPTSAGLTLLIFMIALNISAGTSGYIIGRVVHYKVLPIAGLIIAIGAILTLAWNVDRVSLIWFEVFLVLIGLGFGTLPNLAQVVLQNSVQRHQLGISVGTMTFTRNLLSTFLIAVFGALVSGVTVTGSAPGELGAALAQDAAMAAEAYRRVFFASAATMTVALVSLILIEERPLQSGVASDST